MVLLHEETVCKIVKELDVGVGNCKQLTSSIIVLFVTDAKSDTYSTGIHERMGGGWKTTQWVYHFSSNKCCSGIPEPKFWKEHSIECGYISGQRLLHNDNKTKVDFNQCLIFIKI